MKSIRIISILLGLLLSNALFGADSVNSVKAASYYIEITHSPARKNGTPLFKGSYPLSGNTFRVGRKSKSDSQPSNLDLEFPRKINKISRNHCMLTLDRTGQWRIQDNESSKGTAVENIRLISKTSRALRDGDTVTLAGGVFSFKFRKNKIQETKVPISTGKHRKARKPKKPRPARVPSPQTTRPEIKRFALRTDQLQKQCLQARNSTTHNDQDPITPSKQAQTLKSTERESTFTPEPKRLAKKTESKTKAFETKSEIAREAREVKRMALNAFDERPVDTTISTGARPRRKEFNPFLAAAAIKKISQKKFIGVINEERKSAFHALDRQQLFSERQDNTGVTEENNSLRSLNVLENWTSITREQFLAKTKYLGEKEFKNLCEEIGLTEEFITNALSRQIVQATKNLALPEGLGDIKKLRNQLKRFIESAPSLQIDL